MKRKIFKILGFAILAFFAVNFSLAAEGSVEDEAMVPEIIIEQGNAMMIIEEATIKKPPLVSGSLQTLMGVFFGDMKEFVYTKGIDHELSRLEWEEHFVPYIGIVPELSIGNFFINARLITAIPVKAGNIRDYDYTKIPLSDALTNFSEHNSMLKNHFEISPSAGWTFKIGSAFSLLPYAGFSYRNRNWAAMNGYLEYPPGSPKVEMNGYVITYEESTWFPSVGIIARYDLNKRFTVGLKGACYPYLNVQTIDTHILTKTTYYDKMSGNMSGGWGAFGGFELNCKPLRIKALTFKFEAAYEGLFPPKGTTASGNSGNALQLDKNSQSKMESNLWWISLGIILFPSELLW